MSSASGAPRNCSQTSEPFFKVNEAGCYCGPQVIDQGKLLTDHSHDERAVIDVAVMPAQDRNAEDRQLINALARLKQRFEDMARWVEEDTSRRRQRGPPGGPAAPIQFWSGPSANLPLPCAGGRLVPLKRNGAREQSGLLSARLMQECSLSGGCQFGEQYGLARQIGAGADRKKRRKKIPITAGTEGNCACCKSRWHVQSAKIKTRLPKQA